MQPEIYTQKILQFACQREVSDIFFLLHLQQVMIKMREIDGIHDYQILDKNFAAGVINYLKFTSDMDISEHRRPQVGARNFSFQKQQINLRLSSLGDYANQESLVIRLIYPLRNLVTNDLKEQQWQDIMNQRGLILFNGPTGSGKTTSMYQLTKKYINNKIVLAIEDPVEIIEPQFLQVQVNERAQMSYANLIKTSLRHRPDILILGEIRDEQTSQMAVRAALSGHLVISTVHARNKFAVIGRMMELGVSQRELYSVLNCVVYQRLILQTTGVIKPYRDVLLAENLNQAITIPKIIILTGKECCIAIMKKGFWMKIPIANTRLDKLNPKRQAIFLATLAKLLSNGFSIEASLESMRLILPQENKLLLRIIQRLNIGENLAAALFDTGPTKTILSQIMIAEIHGNLIKCLRENAATLLIRQKNLQKILNLLAYPCFLLISLGLLLLFLRIEMAQQLPY